MIAWTIGGVVLVYVILLVSRILQGPTSAAQNRSLGVLDRAQRHVKPARRWRGYSRGADRQADSPSRASVR